MKLLILAAGYATRLYPLTKNTAKSLLPIAGKPMIEHVIATTEEINNLSEIIVITNERFASDFGKWAKSYHLSQLSSPLITILNDHSTDDTNRLGAIGDMHLAIKTQVIAEDILVVGGDNLFRHSLRNFVAFASNTGPTLGVYDVGDISQMKKFGNVFLDDQSRIIGFEEKPDKPKTTLAAMCLYYYPKNMFSRIDEYLASGNNPDQPGRLIAWLYKRLPVYACEIKGEWLDIGSFETLEAANQAFA